MTVRLETYNGKTQSITAWCHELGKDRKRIWRLMDAGATFEEAINEKPKVHWTMQLTMTIVDPEAHQRLLAHYGKHKPLTPWKREDILTLFRLWRQAYGRQPCAYECRKECYLPVMHVITKHFTRFSHLIALLDASDTTPVAPYAVTSVREKIACLWCERKFYSWDRRKNRLCATCRDRQNMMSESDVDWMCGDIFRPGTHIQRP